MTNLKDYYHILEVEKSATQEEIKKSYRRLALKFHPDRNPGDTKAEERFKLISEAYAVLIDETKRTQYNHAQATARNQPPRDQADAGFAYSQEEIFKEFFSQAYARQSFRDVADEFKRSGYRFDDKFFDRVFFNGRGFFFGGVFFGGPQVQREQQDSGPSYRTTFSGRAKASRPQTPPKPTPPPQVRSQGRLLARMGQTLKKMAQNLLPAGARILERAHITFNLTITPTQANTGAELQVAYQRDGRPQIVAVKIPPGTKNGARLRLKSMGQRLVDGRNGDLFLNVKIMP